MANVFVEARPKGRSEGSAIEGYVVEVHADDVLGTFQRKRRPSVGLKERVTPVVARVRHLNDKKKPDHWRTA